MSKTKRKESPQTVFIVYSIQSSLPFGATKAQPTQCPLMVCEHKPKDPGSWSIDPSVPICRWQSVSPWCQLPSLAARKHSQDQMGTLGVGQWNMSTEKNDYYTIGVTVRNKFCLNIDSSSCSLWDLPLKEFHQTKQIPNYPVLYKNKYSDSKFFNE